MTVTRPRLASRLMQAQALVIGVGAITLIFAAVLIAPRFFRDHLIQAGVTDPDVQLHASEAFTSSFAISVVFAILTALLAAGAVSWFMVRRVSRPVEELARSAESVAAGRYNVGAPDAPFCDELHQLSSSFMHMAQRLAETDATRSRMLANLAHELRTPLATLEAYIDGIEDHVLPDEAATYTTVRMQIQRLRRLASDLRESSAATTHSLGINRELIDMNAVAEAAVAAEIPRFEAKNIALDLVGVPQGACVLGDSFRLEQVMANLLDNALRHTPPGGRVSVTLIKRKSSFHIHVADTGEGIPKDQLHAIFERFHRVDSSRVTKDGGGSGLGLTIAKAIINNHGGNLEAMSEGRGRGSTFVLGLPAAPRR